MDTLNFVNTSESIYIDGLYQEYLKNPESVDSSWRRFFEGFEFGSKLYPKNGKSGTGTASNSKVPATNEQLQKELKVLDLINAYRSRGHLFAKTNPILPNKSYKPTLDIENYGLTSEDLSISFFAGFEIGLPNATLKEIVDFLNKTYCSHIGAEFRYIRHPEILSWLQSRMESTQNSPKYSTEEKKFIMQMLGKAHLFETFLHKKFVGQKRFSLEGGEALIPALEMTLERGAELGIQEFVLGMAHRGRLNVLTNIMRKPYELIFGEFQDKGISDDIFDGDVKYHMGYSDDPVLGNNLKVHLSMAPNPSHLEAVDPVVLGMTRAKMDELYKGDENKVCPILIHGDASIAGQGIVYEVQQMSQLEGYRVGGTVHIVINNQIGFTTDAKDSRSSTYCTDVAKVTLSPVFHVNGDDPEAVAFVTKLAMEFRQTFHRDVFIDIICYRKYGHNEGDEPRFTQPIMYSSIDKHPNPWKIYTERLLNEGVITQKDIENFENNTNELMQKQFDSSKSKEDIKVDSTPRRSWDGIKVYDDNNIEPNPNTKVSEEFFKSVAEKITTLPEGFQPHKTVGQLYANRKKMVFETHKLDWGMGEMMAYATLLSEGYDVRISGQDVRRGTFSHRHAYLVDNTNNELYSPLSNLNDDSKFYCYNSLLSEFGVLGFEYGYSSSAPFTLTIWEAQFGDFVNGAQVIIDQFLSAAKSKWRRLNGLVMLLPHGYEGQGPEHSSCRYERFLNLCAQNNMYVCNFTTPANLFHALRRQIHSEYRRPLIVATPKSLLRLPQCYSTIEDFTQKNLQEVIDDTVDAKKVERVLFCSGKIYYDLDKYRNQFNVENVAIVRVEQLYPIPAEQINKVLEKYNQAKEWFWVQEEPENMGAWPFYIRKFRKHALEVISRKESASPATGSPKQHANQQAYLIKKALNLPKDTELK